MSVRIIQRRLVVLQNYLQDGIYRELREFGDYVVDIAKKNCPVDTGKLRDSIHYEITSNGIIFIADAQAEDGTYYGWYCDYGSSKNLPTYFLSGTVEDYKPFLEAAIERRINELVLT